MTVDIRSKLRRLDMASWLGTVSLNQKARAEVDGFREHRAFTRVPTAWKASEVKDNSTNTTGL